ncbi:MAG: hypothetical protein CMO12_03400 [Thaumarchaeota archaeon]|jgi:hypothetical protein|nr:hypothetical protein [Nitrososphaerota archaeon]|tara:strand:- start:685 stop:873 length:189 start_codon:yes stop_codon:yes gene_type:complete
MFKKGERKYKTRLVGENIPRDQAANILAQASEDIRQSSAEQVYLRLEIRELLSVPEEPPRRR